MAAYLPPGWPAGVHPPGSEGFEQTAVTWLLDVVPPDYRLHGVLLRHPLALAALARHHVAACVAGARQGYRTTRAELGRDLPPGGIAAVLEAYRSEGRRLVETERAVDLVSRALRGEEFVPQLGEVPGRPGSSGDRQAATRTAAGQPGRPAPRRGARRAPDRLAASPAA
ncbi:MAG TPA: hypothetical protein VFV41_26990 [Streptosporangiaceae bacterium]|nr:hypothetical protein [Streptosporangiaceae bacterium]